jgi:hypothetical protein
VQLVHHARPHLHQPMPMPQQLPRVAVLPVRHPDAPEAAFHHQLQQQFGVLPVRLLFAHATAADLGRVANPQLHSQFLQQPFKPPTVPAGFHTHPDLHTVVVKIAVGAPGCFHFVPVPLCGRAKTL